MSATINKMMADIGNNVAAIKKAVIDHVSSFNFIACKSIQNATAKISGNGLSDAAKGALSGAVSMAAGDGISTEFSNAASGLIVAAQKTASDNLSNLTSGTIGTASDHFNSALSSITSFA
jgi:uncharacterized protein (UPF0264 family)